MNATSAKEKYYLVGRCVSMDNPAQQPESCIHEPLCKLYQRGKFSIFDKRDCTNDCDYFIRSRPTPSPQETPLPHIPTPCSYLYIEGMNVHCQDSYSPSRVNCHHCVNWRCWDTTNIRETTIRNATLDELLDRMADIDAWGEKKEGYLINDDDVKSLVHKMKSESLHTNQEPHP